METCVRGFSFMPKENISSDSLQYIEGEELTRKWRASRRERQKQREQKIWEEFVVKENDVLSTICKEDPYQFLEQLPEDCLKELMDAQLKKMQKEKDEEDAKIMELSQRGEGDVMSPHVTPTSPVTHAVTFATDDDRDDNDLFYIFDDKDEEKSGQEDEVTNGSLSPSTVRELSPDSRPLSPEKVSSKSSENVANMIENSIYFAKVKETRMKISEELDNIVLSLESSDMSSAEGSQQRRTRRRSAEFSGRFTRVHLYQLTRQISDLERSSGQSLPYAKHTQFQAQMVRIASLHQNMLQALQVFNKSIEQTACVCESIDTLRALVSACRQAGAASHHYLVAAGNLGTDKVIPSCDSLDEAINEYAAKIASFMEDTEDTHTSHSRKSVKSKGKSSPGNWSKSVNAGKSVGTRLSMYSLDTMRINLKPKSAKDVYSGPPSRPRRSKPGPTMPGDPHSPKRNAGKKSPRSRRPLMRDPHSGRGKAKRRVTRETDIRTMVETVGTVTCTSSRVSCALSSLPPRHTPHSPRTPHSPHTNPPRTPTSLKTNPAKFRKPVQPREGNMSSEVPEMGAVRPKGGKGERRATTHDVERLNETPRSVNVNSGRTSETPRSFTEAPRATADVPRAGDTPLSVAEITRAVAETSRGTEMPRAAVEMPRAAVEMPRATVESPRESCETRSGNQATKKEMMAAEKRCDAAAKERNKISASSSSRCEVGRIVRQLCGGDTAGTRNERVSGAKNAQLMCISGSSPRQPSTPQLLRILEETIQKKVPKQLFHQPTNKDMERFRMVFNIPEVTSEKMFQYRTKFVQHMLTSPMYANSLVGKPWEVISSISDQIIDDLLATCATEIQMEDTVQKLYEAETR